MRIWADQNRRRLLVPAVIVAAVLASVLLVGAGLLLLWHSGERAVRAAAAENVGLVALLERNTAQAVETLRVVIATAGREAGIDFDDSGARSSYEAWLADMMRETPQVEIAGVVDLAGRGLLHALARAREPHAAALAAMTKAAAEMGEELHVGKPVRDGLSGSWLLPVGRAISPRRSGAGRAIVLLVSLKPLLDLYGSVDTGAMGSVVLVHRNGTILARHPQISDEPGRNLGADVVLATGLDTREAGEFQMRSVIDGVERIGSFRRVAASPLVISVTRSVPEVIARWRADLSADFVVAGLCATLLLSLALALLRAARARDVADAHLDATLANMTQGLVMIDADQRIKIYNRRALELLELPEPLLRGRPSAAEVYDYQEKQGEFASLTAAKRGAITLSILADTPGHYERVRPDGTVLDIRTMPLPAGGAVRTYTDITERTKAIEDMHASMAFANSLINSSPDCIQLLDLDGRITFISDLGRELMEIDDFEAVRGRPFSELFPDEHRPRVELALRRVRDGQTDRFTRQCPTLGGIMRWWEFIITPVHEIGREPERMFVVARDVSARQAHAEELGRAKEAAERASQSKTQFLAAMSHEMRTPLTAILGFAALARQRVHDDPELQRQIELMHKAGDALRTLIDDVLDLSKIEAGKVELEERPLALRGLVEDCLSLTRGLADHKALALDCTVDPQVPARVLADEARLRQILLNLLNNAIKFTPHGQVRLEVAPATAAGAIAFVVSDTGIGIPADRLPRLFQDFVQGDGSIARQYGGTGLGLSISRRLAALMGGTIEVASIAGQGSTFTVTLPLRDVPDLSSANAAIVPPPQPTATPRTILLVDDLSINLEIVGEMLASAGHEVCLAGSGPTAIAACRQRRHDLILMDVQMPDMDGLETTRHIRELGENGRDVPVIALTANVFPQQIVTYRQAGMNDHLGKPFHRGALLDMVARWTDAEARPSAVSGEPAGGEEVPPAVDAAGQQELAGLIGRDKFNDLLARLREDLPQRFHSSVPSALRHDAHALASTAGLLGFARLSAASRALEQAIVDEGDVAVALIAVCEERCRTGTAIAQLLATETMARTALPAA